MTYSNTNRAKSIAIIDSIKGLEKSYKYKPDILITDNILLYNKILSTTSIKIYNSDETITNEDIDKWGTLLIKLGQSIDLELNSMANNHKLKDSIQEVGNTSMYILSLICKVKGLIRTLYPINIKKLIIIYTNNKYWEKSPKHLRFISPYPLLVQNSFFGKAKVILDEIKVSNNINVNKTNIDNFLLRFLSNKISYTIIWKIINNKFFKFKNATTVLKGDSEIIREYITKLVLGGTLPITYYNIIRSYRSEFTENQSKLFKFKDKIEKLIKQNFNKNFNFNKDQLDAIVSMIIANLEKKLQQSLFNTKEIDYFFNQLNKKYKNITSIIVSAPNASTAKYFHKIAKKNKIKIINFEHGMTTGVALRNKHYVGFSEATNCDFMFVINELAAKEYKLIKKNKIAELFIIGLPSQIKNIIGRPIQNFILRRKHQLKQSDFCICHVSTLIFNGGIRYGPSMSSDKEVTCFNNKILFEVYEKLKNKKIIFKDYPSARHIYQPKLKERVTVKNKNIIFEEEGDWRYLRAVSNLIITMGATSTLSWCIACRVPLVYINLKTKELRYNWLNDKFKESFFYFDASQDNWADKLKYLLSKSPEEINNMWLEKEELREKFINSYLFPEKDKIITDRKLKQFF